MVCRLGVLDTGLARFARAALRAAVPGSPFPVQGSTTRGVRASHGGVGEVVDEAVKGDFVLA